MTRIEQIVVGGGPTVAEARERLHRFLNGHPDHVFTLNDSDILDVRSWLTQPESDKPPPAFDELATYSMTAIRHAFRILRSQGKIATVELGGRTYYGTRTAVNSMRKRMRKARRPKTSKASRVEAVRSLAGGHWRASDPDKT